MIRPEIRELVSLGQFPASKDVLPDVIGRQETLLQSIVGPVTRDEAMELARLFGPDDYFGGAWTLVHLIESTPNWPIQDVLAISKNEWITRLTERAERE